MIENSFINSPVNLIMITMLMGLLPFFLTLATSYIKVVVVTYLIRNALGVQQVPPGMVLSGLAMILSVFIMAPVGQQTYALLEKQNVSSQFTPTEFARVISSCSDPLKNFLMKMCNGKLLTKAFRTIQILTVQTVKLLLPQMKITMQVYVLLMLSKMIWIT